MNTSVLNVLQITVAVVIVIVILMQVRGGGTALFGQAESSFRTRRGIERALFRGTIVLALVFTVLAVLTVRQG